MKQKHDDKTIDWVDTLSSIPDDTKDSMEHELLDVYTLPYDVARCKGVYKKNIDSNESELSLVCIDCLRRTSKWSDVWQPVVMVSELDYNDDCNLKMYWV